LESLHQIGIIASIDVIPVCNGSQTDLRLIIPGAIASNKRLSAGVISPFPSIGAPNGFTTRPKNSSPTGI